jgi:hypothetical protein
VYAQHDLTLTTRNSSEIFYARDGRLSFHTAKTLSGHRGGVDDLIWEADKYPSSRQVRYDFGAMPLAGGIFVQQTIARHECVRFTRAYRHASAT